MLDTLSPLDQRGEPGSLPGGPTCLTILPTFQCTAACKNCCFGSHPWIKGRIPQSDILRYIQEAAQFSNLDLVCFSGGECFLLGQDLVEAIGTATRLGLATRCVTNGYWANSVEAAERTLLPLRDAGLSEINFSTGDSHSEFVPVQSILHGAYVARGLGLTVAIMVELSGTQRVSGQVLRAHPLFRQYFGEGDPMVLISESPWISMDEGCETVEYADSQFINRNNVAQRRGCPSILSTIVATPQKELFACCGITSEQIPEVKLGMLDDTPIRVLYDEASKDFLKIWLAVDGPEKILSWAAGFDAEIDWENRFAHQCDACQFMYQEGKVRKVIAQHHGEVMQDVLLRFALLHPVARPVSLLT